MNDFDELVSRLDTAEERISALVDISIEIPKLRERERKGLIEIEQARDSGECL